MWAGLCVSCQVCCAGEYEDPWDGREREGLCQQADCGCGNCCDGDGCCGDCDCCDCGC